MKPRRHLFLWIAIWTMGGDVDAAVRPNVVVFLADDAGWGDFSHSGNQQVATPRIDSLARNGVSLERFFVCPVCAPTRAEFLTGRYYPRGGVRGVSTGQERLDLSEKTVADAFRAAGYATGAFGKWHNGSQWPYHPMARGFDSYFGHTSGHWGEYFDPPLEENGRMIQTRGYIVDLCTDRALAFIDQNKDRPFFCYLPFTTPHSPWSAPAENWRKWKARSIGQRGDPDKENLDETRCALAMIENQDANVGRVLDKLETLGLTENTVVVYFSDNGPNTPRWRGGMKGSKGSTDEGGVRSVCYLRYPAKLGKGRVVKEIAGAIDLYPTLAGLADVPRVGAKPFDGRDLGPLLRGEATPWPERMVFSTWGGRVSVRTQRHRFDDRGQLFDMESDPGQTTPINDRAPEKVRHLSLAVAAWRREMFGADKSIATKGVTKKDRQSANEVDPRPIPVGYREFPITMLPARDGAPIGAVRRSSPAPNCSYFVNWTTLADQMVWKLAVETTGRYKVSIDYTCKASDVGAEIELAFGPHRLAGVVTQAWDPPLFTNQDTLPRPHGESQMKAFRPLELGEINLTAGAGPLTLRALKIPGAGVIDVRRVTLTLVNG